MAWAREGVGQEAEEGWRIPRKKTDLTLEGIYKRQRQSSSPWLTRKTSGSLFSVLSGALYRVKSRDPKGLPSLDPTLRSCLPFLGLGQDAFSFEKGKRGKLRLSKADVRSGSGGLARRYSAVCEVSSLQSELNGSPRSQRDSGRSRSCVLFAIRQPAAINQPARMHTRCYPNTPGPVSG